MNQVWQRGKNLPHRNRNSQHPPSFEIESVSSNISYCRLLTCMDNISMVNIRIYVFFLFYLVIVFIYECNMVVIPGQDWPSGLSEQQTLWR